MMPARTTKVMPGRHGLRRTRNAGAFIDTFESALPPARLPQSGVDDDGDLSRTLELAGVALHDAAAGVVGPPRDGALREVEVPDEGSVHSDLPAVVAVLVMAAAGVIPMPVSSVHGDRVVVGSRAGVERQMLGVADALGVDR